ncbi:MAG: M48 family metalloprotease [Alphaproteobacteria bacterium]
MSASLTRATTAIALILAAGPLTTCKTDNLGAYDAPLASRQNADAAAAADTGPLPYRTGDLKPNERPAPDSDEAGLWLAVDRVESGIKTAGNRIAEPKINAYLQNVVCRVAGPHCKDIRVYLLRVPAFNAGMYPNGTMEIWTGFLLRVRNEAQLASVIGHETGHFLRRHSLQRTRNIIEATNTFAFLQFALAGVGAGAGISAVQIAMVGGIYAFSRDNEREADGYGILLMSEGGYDPREASKVWKQLLRERNAHKDAESRRPDPFSSTHPAGEERADALDRLAARVMTPKSTDLGRDRFLEAVLPIRAGLLRDELHRRQFDTFAELLDMLMEDGANMAELHYFKGELHRLRGKEDDARIALDAYNAAKTAQGRAPNDIDRSMALVYRRLGRSDDARAALGRYLAANPDAPDAAMIRQMLEGS